MYMYNTYMYTVTCAHITYMYTCTVISKPASKIYRTYSLLAILQLYAEMFRCTVHITVSTCTYMHIHMYMY